MDVRKPLNLGRYEQETQLREQCRARLSDDPLALALVKWIDYEDLQMACESVGMIKGGKGELITVGQVVTEATEIMRDALKRTE